jgi:hypothetical protein
MERIYDIHSIGNEAKVKCSCGNILTPVQLISKGAFYMRIWNCVECQKKLDKAQYEKMLENSIKTRLR